MQDNAIFEIVKGFVNSFGTIHYEEDKALIKKILSNNRGWKAGLKTAAKKRGFPNGFIPSIKVGEETLYYRYMGGRSGQEYVGENGEHYMCNPLTPYDLTPCDDNHDLNTQ